MRGSGAVLRAMSGAWKTCNGILSSRADVYNLHLQCLYYSSWSFTTLCILTAYITSGAGAGSGSAAEGSSLGTRCPGASMFCRSKGSTNPT